MYATIFKDSYSMYKITFNFKNGSLRYTNNKDVTMNRK